MSKIKVLHTADIHIGIENYGYINPNTGLNARMEDFLRSFDIIIDHAINNDFDMVIFAGDAFKVQSPNSTQQREFAKRVYRLAKAKIPTILLAGNHDLSNRYGEATSMDIYGTLKIDNVHVVEKPQFLPILTKSGLVQVIAIPYVSKSALLTNEDYRTKTVEEIEKILVKKIDDLITKYIITADQAVPLVLTFHVGIDQATIGAEKDLMVGKSFSIPLSVVARKELDYVALGHIHKHQVLCPKPPVIYPGSIERVDFGEEKEEKGFVVIDLEKDNTTYEFIKLPARTFITIKVDVTESEDPNKDIIEAIQKKDIKDAIVRLKYEATTNNNHLIDDKLISQHLTGAFFYMIRPNIMDNAPRTRQPELNESVSIDPIQALEKFLLLHPHLEEYKDDLLERAKQLMEIPAGG
jgi:exonuclease SbcD